MSILAALLLKDLRRAWRNPVGWVIFLAIPLVITALIGLVFGPKSSGAGLGHIRFAVVDEDQSALTRLLHGSLNQREAREHLDPVFLDRTEALRQVQDNKLSAMIVIPAGFTRRYLTSTNGVILELVKNPAESINPAVLEELLGIVVVALDAVKQHFGPELLDWQAVFDGAGDYHRVSQLIVRAGDKIEAARKILIPPRVVYAKIVSPPPEEVRESTITNQTRGVSSEMPRGKEGTSASGHSIGDRKPAAVFNIFGYLLPGLAAMFLLFLAENASRDIHREMQQRTLQRFRTLHPRLVAFLASKVLFCLVFLLLSSAVILGGGGLIFRIVWREPWAVVLLTASYCAFAAGLMVLLPALLSDQRSSQALSTVTAMLLGMVGGSMVPADQLPGFLRNYLCPLLPNYWYIEAVRAVSFGSQPGAWLGVAAKTALLGTALMLAAAMVLGRRLEKGGK